MSRALQDRILVVDTAVITTSSSRSRSSGGGWGWLEEGGLVGTLGMECEQAWSREAKVEVAQLYGAGPVISVDYDADEEEEEGEDGQGGILQGTLGIGVGVGSDTYVEFLGLPRSLPARGALDAWAGEGQGVGVGVEAGQGVFAGRGSEAGKEVDPWAGTGAERGAGAEEVEVDEDDGWSSDHKRKHEQVARIVGDWLLMLSHFQYI